MFAKSPEFGSVPPTETRLFVSDLDKVIATTGAGRVVCARLEVAAFVVVTVLVSVPTNDSHLLPYWGACEKL